MTVHRIPIDRLEQALAEIVRGRGEKIDAITTDENGDWLIITEDSPLETRVDL